MKITVASIPDVFTLEPEVFQDNRGFFYESFNQRQFRELTGITVKFVQDNHSKSAKNVLRGLHYQIQRPQGKLVRVVAGEVFDVAVDIRRKSPTFGKWVSTYLSADNMHQRWIPAGFAHGFAIISESAELLYKTTDYWRPEFERCILWNDPVIDIKWPLAVEPVLSSKDKLGDPLVYAEVFE